ncbi:type VI secretion protein IcmF/TssM N-terminal domain-containing protein [Planctomycetota bacterium]
MVPGISVYKNLPTPFKIGLSVIACGGILAAMLLLVPSRVLWIIFIGLAVVVLILLLYWRILKWLKKRKAAPMEHGVIENASAAPQGVSEAAHLARLDELRKKFEEGITKFQAAGKSLYNFPWYMIVGEPGSGKTEAVRHCNVGFPPGLQDQFQGAGGTLNMNWWFTDHAVILDTAGRLMFEEVETGGSGEWKEFLKLLKKYRPRCPVNGVFLVIPADSLIKDTADEIEQKASKIARQFDAIQRILDVRFPVFVVVTKSDLINGFRDFFDNLDDPQLQHQILGWSNPAPLDEPYNPDFVEQHLKAIQKRLFRRRLALLQDMVSESEETGMEKMRTTDTLYAFPQSLAKIAPRMARYLELIFSVGSQWSGKPLFFRGIYFTSSMREGSALDEDLAESLGVSVDTFPDGRVWERDRAYFLRDLFIKKVFREKGLVTYATNAKKQHLRRKAIVLVSAAVSVILLLFCTFYAGIQFRRSIGDMKEYFEAPAKLFASNAAREASQLHVIKSESQGVYRYIGRSGVPEMPEDITRSGFSARLADRVDQWEKKGVPWIFAPAAKFTKGITSEKLNTAQAVIYETAILRPFLDASSQIMDNQKNGKWRRENPETRSLCQLIRLKADKPLAKEGEYSTQAFLDPLFAYIFRGNEEAEDEEAASKRIQMYNDDKVQLHQPIEFIYGEAFSPVFIKTDPDFLETAIDSGVNLFNAYWSDSNQVGSSSRDFAQVETIEKLRMAFGEFDAAEKNILALQDSFGDESSKSYADERWNQFVTDWEKQYKSLDEARQNIRNLSGSLNNPKSLEKFWGTVAQDTLQDVNDHYQFLLSELRTDKAIKNEFLGRMRTKLEAIYNEISGRLVNSEFAEELKLIDERFFAPVREENRLYEVRFQMYSKCNEQFVEIKPYALNEVRLAIQKVNEGVEEARNSINGLLALGPTVFRFKQAADICGLAIELPRQRGLYSVVESSLKSAPKSIKEVGDFVAEQGKWDWSDLVPSDMINRSYDPKVAEDILSGWKTLRDTLQRLPKETRLQKEFMDANEIYTEYPKLYFEYWLGTVPEAVVRSSVERNSDEYKSLIVRNVFDEQIAGLGVLLENAVTPLRPYAPEGDQRIKLFDDNLDKVRDSRKYDKFYNECRTVLKNWRGLGDNLTAGRMELLRISPADYLEDYAPFAYESPAEFADMYWTEFTLKMLSMMAGKVQDDGKEAFENLRTQFAGKFPLERDSKTNLTQKELTEAWSSLNKVRLQEIFAQGAIGAGEKTGSDKINEQLKNLNGMILPEPYKQWFEGIEQVFKSLPQAEDPYYCKIILLGQNEQRKLVGQNEKLLLDYLTEFGIVQGDQNSERFNTRSGENMSVGMFKYPASSLQIEFYQYPSDTEKHTSVEFPQPWAPLRMLHQYHDARKEGYVKLEVKSEKDLGGVLFLQLEFFKDIDGKYPVSFPGPDQWPSLKDKR